MQVTSSDAGSPARASHLAGRSDPYVGVWLLALAVLVLLMIVVGGMTRLTDSGLSITEWRPVTGAVPPLNEAAWNAEFEKYRLIPEYLEQNRGMSLEEFKLIYWWEWGHRQLGRTIGLVVLLPLIGLALAGRLRGAGLARGVGLLLLVGLQGAIGWWMVASGLVDRLDVSQHRLATHLGVAFIILGLLTWSALEAWNAPRAPSLDAVRPGVRALAFGFASLIFLQIIAGAYVAGLDAGRINTGWPLIEGRLIPEDYWALEPLWRNALDNRATVQVNHRLLGYLITLVGLAIAVRARAGEARALAWALGAGCSAQAALGVVTLVHAAPITLSALHQLGAALLFALALAYARALSLPRRSLARAH